MTDELNSLISVIQLKIAPERTPGIIICAVTLKNDFAGESRKLMDASSMLALIWYKIAELERSVYAMRRITSDTTIIAAVPDKITAP